MIWKKLMRRARYAYWRWRVEGRNVNVKRSVCIGDSPRHLISNEIFL